MQDSLTALKLMRSSKQKFDILKDLSGTIHPVSSCFTTTSFVCHILGTISVGLGDSQTDRDSKPKVDILKNTFSGTT